MLATSTLVKPQQSLIEIILNPDASNLSVTPAYFSVEVTKFMLNRKLIALESYCDADFQYSPISPGVHVVPFGTYLALTLTLMREPGNGVPGGDFYKNIPLIQLRRSAVQGAVPWGPDLFRCEPTEVSWSDSYGLTATPVNIGTDPISVPFLATYLLPEQDPEPYRNVLLKRR